MHVEANPFHSPSPKKTQLKKPNQIMSLLISYLVLALFSSITSSSCATTDIVAATEEMQKANYFTFVMLINMVPSQLFSGNLTFLMPNDRTLSKTVFPENAISDFLLRHSIPSPLLFDHLLHFPTNSIVPTLKPDSMLRVSNDGRQRFFLDNVRIRSPNICTAGSSIRCHGIDGVIQVDDHNVNASSRGCSSNIPTVPPAPGPLPSPTPTPSVLNGVNLTPSAAPATLPKSAGYRGKPLAGFTMIFMMLVAIYLS